MCPPALHQLLIPLCPVQQQPLPSAHQLQGVSKALCTGLMIDTLGRLVSPAHSSGGAISAWFWASVDTNPAGWHVYGAGS